MKESWSLVRQSRQEWTLRENQAGGLRGQRLTLESGRKWKIPGCEGRKERCTDTGLGRASHWSLWGPHVRNWPTSCYWKMHWKVCLGWSLTSALTGRLDFEENDVNSYQHFFKLVGCCFFSYLGLIKIYWLITGFFYLFTPFQDKVPLCGPGWLGTFYVE